jgi:hypothetical protein
MTWTKSDIRAARKADLVDILTDRSYLLHPLQDGNFRVLPDPDYPSRPSGIIVKQNYWSWPDRDLSGPVPAREAMSGNTIEFFLYVEGKTFQDAMRIIAPHIHNDPSERNLREERGRDPETLR